MAGVAGDFDFVFEVGLVDGYFHFDHFSRRLFFFFVVFVHGVFDVAELAVDAEGASDELHGGDELVGGDVFQGLNIFELLRGGFWRGLFLGESQGGVHEKCAGEKESRPAKLSREKGIHPWVSCEIRRN